MKKRILKLMSLTVLLLTTAQYAIPAFAVTTDNFTDDGKTSESKSGEVSNSSSSNSNNSATDKDMSAQKSTSESEEEKNSTTDRAESKQSVYLDSEPENLTPESVTVGTWGTVSWTFDSATGLMEFTSGGTLGEYDTAPWNTTIDKLQVKKINFDYKVYAPENSFSLFTGLVNVTNLNVENIDTSNTTSMKYMFQNMSSLLNLDISKFNTSKVTNFLGTFTGLSSLKTLNVANLDTSKATDMSYMFQTTNIENIDLSNFDTSNVTDMSYMFWGTKSKTINISNFKTSNVTDMSYMFYNSSAVKDLDLSSFNTGAVINFKAMFAGASSLNKVNLINFVTSNAMNMDYMFQATSLESLNLSNFDTTSVETMDKLFDSSKLLKELTLGAKSIFKGDVSLSNISITNGYTGKWKYNSDNTVVGTSTEFMNNYDGSKTGTYSWQQKLWGTVPWDFDSTTGTLTFYGKGTLGEYNTSPWERSDSLKINRPDVKKIIFNDTVSLPVDSRRLFSSLGNLLSIEGTDKFDTSNVTNMSSMFHQTPSLTSLNINNFDTSKVTNMSSMFQQMSSLTSLDLSNFDTSKVTNMSSMFQQMSSLTSLDLSNFDTSKITNMSSMFNSDSKLSSIKLGSKFTDITNSSRLPNITASGYSGNWKYTLDDSTVGTSTQFFANYDGSNPGTYVWESAKDPITPSDTTQTQLTLKTVPTSFLFKSSLSSNEYTLSSSLTLNNTITVFNNRLDRDWYVKAIVVDNALTLATNSKVTFPVSSFKINAQDVLSTGSTGIVSKSETAKTLKNNVGEISNTVSTSNLTFNDSDGKLKAGDKLKGTVRYQLYNVPKIEDLTSIKVKDSTLYSTENFNPENNFISATDKDGNSIPFSSITVSGSIDKTKFTNQEITYTYGGKTAKSIVTVKEDLTSIKVKDSTLYSTENFNPENNFISATDKDGNSIPFSSITVSGSIDKTKFTNQEITYTYGGKTAKSIVTVKEDLTSIKVRNLVMYKDDIYNINYSFISAVNEKNDSISLKDLQYTNNIDTSTIGTQVVKFTYGNISAEAKVSILDSAKKNNKTKIMETNGMRVYIDTDHYESGTLLRGGILTAEVFSHLTDALESTDNPYIIGDNDVHFSTIPYDLSENVSDGYTSLYAYEWVLAPGTGSGFIPSVYYASSVSQRVKIQE